jgi:hypothetical protein
MDGEEESDRLQIDFVFPEDAANGTSAIETPIRFG